MSFQHIERRAARNPQGAKPFNRAEEKLSEYFAPDRGERKVLRYELLSILTMIEKGKRNLKWYRRLWRFLKAPRGSGPVEANPQPEAGETVLGVKVGPDRALDDEPEAGRGT